MPFPISSPGPGHSHVVAATLCHGYINYDSNLSHGGLVTSLFSPHAGTYKCPSSSRKGRFRLDGQKGEHSAWAGKVKVGITGNQTI